MIRPVRHARVKDTVEDGPMLVKTWVLRWRVKRGENRLLEIYFRYSWIPEGERFALETGFTEEEVEELVAACPHGEEEGDEDVDDEEEAEEIGEEIDEEDEDDAEECEEDLEDEEKAKEEHESDDETLSENEDSSEDNSAMEEGEDDGDTESLHEINSSELLGKSRSPFLIYTDLTGTAYIKSNMHCR